MSQFFFFFFFFVTETRRVCNAAGAWGRGDPRAGHPRPRSLQCAQRPPGGARGRGWGSRGQARKVQERGLARGWRGTDLGSPFSPPGKPRSGTWRLRDPASLPDGASGNFDRCREGPADFPPQPRKFPAGQSLGGASLAVWGAAGRGSPHLVSELSTGTSRKTLHAKQAALSSRRLQPPAGVPLPRSLPSGRAPQARSVPLDSGVPPSLGRSAREIVGASSTSVSGKARGPSHRSGQCRPLLPSPAGALGLSGARWGKEAQWERGRGGPVSWGSPQPAP